MSDDLVKRLRAVDPLCATSCCVGSPMYDEAADTIAALTAERDALRAVLESLERLTASDAAKVVAALSRKATP